MAWSAVHECPTAEKAQNSDKRGTTHNAPEQGLKKPIGVAQWQTKLVESLPKNLKGSLPTVAEIEAELDNVRTK